MLCVLLQAPISAASDYSLQGIVKDRSGAVVVNADVTFRTATQEFTQTTRSDGTFSFTGLDVSSGTLAISAKGFAVSMTEWRAGGNDLAITLQPAMVEESLDITATRTAILPTGIDDFSDQLRTLEAHWDKYDYFYCLPGKARGLPFWTRRNPCASSNPTRKNTKPPRRSPGQTQTGRDAVSKRTWKGPV